MRPSGRSSSPQKGEERQEACELCEELIKSLKPPDGFPIAQPEDRQSFLLDVLGPIAKPDPRVAEELAEMASRTALS